MRRTFLRDSMDSFKSQILQHVFWDEQNLAPKPLWVVPMRTDGGWTDQHWFLYHENLGGVKRAGIVDTSVFTALNRADYFNGVRKQLELQHPHVVGVFIDPNNGMTPPRGTATKDHVRRDEIQLLLSLENVEVVAVYQHQFRSNKKTPLRGISYVEDALLRAASPDYHVCGYFGGAVSMLFICKTQQAVNEVRKRLMSFAGPMTEDRVR